MYELALDTRNLRLSYNKCRFLKRKQLILWDNFDMFPLLNFITSGVYRLYYQVLLKRHIPYKKCPPPHDGY